MNRFVARVGAMLLIGSIGLNLYLLVKAGSASDLDQFSGKSVASDPLSGVKVRWIGESFYPLEQGEKLQLDDLIDSYSRDGDGSSEVIAYTGLDRQQAYYSYNQISWIGDFPKDRPVELSPGDEVHFHQIRPPLNSDYYYRVTDDGVRRETGRLGHYPIPLIKLGRVLYSSKSINPSDSSSSGTFVIELADEEFGRLETWIEQIRQRAENGLNGHTQIRHESLPAEHLFKEWSWPEGADFYRIRGGDYYLNITKFDGSNTLLCTYDED